MSSRLIGAMIAVAVATTVAACGGSESTTSPETSATEGAMGHGT